ncbi:phage regulatory protein/antirepressor Ant [Epibacterium ulvae]|uniref:phage regulatory protein/antirepressor Ant n=1 Tax=Epibacterium ulvae TaxID=1156985 RepID=UPI002493C8F5|nr:phage regulatory protein/antirepressor Ant [Epibacterium ulvae]
MNIAVKHDDFNGLVNDSLKTTSRIIAEKFEKAHNHVLRDIRKLIEANPEWGMTNFGQTPYVDQQNGQTYQMYEITRDGYSMLVMGFTGKKAMEWKIKFLEAFNAMEQQVQTVPASLSGPQLMAAALIEAQSTLNQQVQEIENMREDVEALDRISSADGSLNITEAAKGLGVRPKDLFSWLSQNGWIYKRNGAGSWLGYSSKCNAGLLEHKTTTVLRADGSEKVTEQVRVTAKGLTRLAKLIPGVAREVKQ